MSTKIEDPPDPLDEVRENLLRVQPFFSALHLWEEVLTKEEQQLLGGDFRAAYAQGGTTGMWTRLHRVSQPRAIIELALELGFLDERKKKRLIGVIGELADSVEQAISQAVVSKVLVLVERDRKLYWKGTLVEIDWHNHPSLWNFIFVLCERAKSGGSVDYTHFAKDVQPEYASKTKSKLGGIAGFPADLVNHIVAAGRSAQKLDLPADDICLFEIKTIEILQQRY
jgi:hypothetical protein